MRLLDKIEKRGNKYLVLSMEGETLGEHSTLAAAEAQLRAIEARKYVDFTTALRALQDKKHADSWVTRIDLLEDLHIDPARADGMLATETPEGFLKVDARISRTGTQVYRDADGNEWNELREDAEVFHPVAMASFQGAVVTDNHPAEFVNLENVKDLQVGHVSASPVRDGRYVRTQIVITDKDVIRTIKDGKTQLSCGYETQIVLDSGVTADGTPYKGRQTNIRGNHIAIVDKGRAGPECRLLLDAADAYSYQKDEAMKTKKITLNKVEHELPTDVVDAILQERKDTEDTLAAFTKEVDTLKKDADTKPTPKPAAPKPTEGEAELKGRIDSLEAELKAQKEGEAARVDARVTLVTHARAILGSDTKTDGVSDSALMSAIVTKVQPTLKETLDAHKEDVGFIRGAYLSALRIHATNQEQNNDANQLIFDAITSNADNSDSDDLDKLAADLAAKRRDGWKLQNTAAAGE